MFKRAQAGHAPGHLRAAFLECIVPDGDEVHWDDVARQAWWDQASSDDRLRWLAGQLWNCTDVVPGLVCDELEWTGTRSYAALARAVRAGTLVAA